MRGMHLYTACVASSALHWTCYLVSSGQTLQLQRSGIAMPSSTPERKSLLLFGASRGLGLAIAEEYLKLDWRVVATARQESGTALHDLVGKADGRLEIEAVDIADPAQITALRERLGSDRFDLMFVNAGVTNDDRETTADVSNEEFVRVMVTNALSPMRVVEMFKDLVPPTGAIAIMSSGQGSVSNNGVIVESSPNRTLRPIEDFRARISQRSEGVSERFGGPDIIAVEGDVLPAERRDVGKKLVGDDFAARTQFTDGAAEIDGVP
jgi:hypothetical protein